MEASKQNLAVKISCLLGALAVLLGAFGAHGLHDRLELNGRVETWETAAFYHLVHAVVLLLLSSRSRWSPGPWLLMTAGLLVFSGSLYLLSLTNVGWLGAITPVGGIGLVAAWIWASASTFQ
jgi:uncharacterized membrane protein YgdD (TMEM256/DUF423 family)